ncbi:hypothetical protein GCM10023209_25740 [Roseibacterium beibuensis]|uniref:Uncharacterized protein n=1 Tax=[Roseibacterium] beibuensis TaxID=1193142 RepID=A0ABP9LI96_9RHOB
MAALGIGMDDIGIAHIDDPRPRPEIGDVILVVIGPGMANAKSVEASRIARGPKRAPARHRVPKSNGAPRMATSA